MSGVNETGFREVRICGECGAVAEMTDSACPNCGADLPEEGEEGQPEA